MPRLQILQHKSYHPYLEPNKQRVRDDEAKAAAIEAEEESKLLNASSEARLDLLRRRQDDPHASSSSSSLMPAEPSKLLTTHRRDLEKKISEKRDRKGPEFDWPAEEKRKAEKREAREERNREKGRGSRKGKVDGGGDRPLGMDEEIKFEDGKHINFWSGMEAETSSLPPVKPKTEPKPTPDTIQDDDPTTMYLNRPERETKPWYTDADLRKYEERGVAGEEAKRKLDRKRANDERHKSTYDPFAQVKTALSFTMPPPTQPYSKVPAYARPNAIASGSGSIPSSISDPLLASRLKREDSERVRAMSLIQEAKRKAERELNQTPSTAYNDDDYGDRWNARELEETRRRKESVKGWSRAVPRIGRDASTWAERPSPGSGSRRRETQSIDRSHRRSPPTRSWGR